MGYVPLAKGEQEMVVRLLFLALGCETGREGRKEDSERHGAFKRQQ